MNKKNILLVFLVIGILGAFIFYQTHKSVDKELTASDLELKKILESKKVENLNEYVLEDMNISQNSSNAASNNDNNNIPNIIKMGMFDSEAQDSDTFHRAWGSVQILEFNGQTQIVFGEDFKVTNAPDLMIYFVKEKDVETKDRFKEIKSDSILIDEMKQFEGFQTYDLSSDINLDQIKGVIIWCEKFGVYMSYANLE